MVKKPIKPKKKLLKKPAKVESPVAVDEPIVHIENFGYQSDGREIKWCNDVCMNPLRYINLDCEGCQFVKKCQAICKYDYSHKYAKKKVSVEEEDEKSVLLDAPEPIKVKTKTEVKPKPKSSPKNTGARVKPKAVKTIRNLSDDLDI